MAQATPDPIAMSPVGEARKFHPGMGQAVAERTILRKREGAWEDWSDVAVRVAVGNCSLIEDPVGREAEYQVLVKHLRKATTIMSGRHLQHGDANQNTRNKEVFTNCSTAPASFLSFYLLLNGSGVGRCFDDELMLVDWDNAPTLRCVLSHQHKDFDWSAHESVRDALHKYGPGSRSVVWFKVPDSREGWAQALETWEVMAFEKINRDRMLILDFSDVRPKGSPIAGMQDRPASGPVPLMNAFQKAAGLKGSGLERWKQAVYVDHYFSECVLVGGARRAARMSTKSWRDPGVIDFIRVKRPIEFQGKTLEEVLAIRAERPPEPFLWSSNNSVTVDREFWRLVNLKRSAKEYKSKLAAHARAVFKEVARCSYGDGTGEPGVINVDQLVTKTDGLDKIARAGFAGSKRYEVSEDAELYLSKLAKAARGMKYPFIVNPCGEIVLSVLGGYCVIGDVVPFHCDTLDEAEDAFRATTRALIRTNLMDCLYKGETKRTNRIGVAITGIHEFAWKFFHIGFRDAIKPDFEALARLDNAWYAVAGANRDPHLRAASFWLTLERFSSAVVDEARSYCKELGVSVPHTMLTIKPSGTVSKLFGLTEGWHLPSMEYYLRWVQFRGDDPLVKTYADAGYPVRELRSYPGTTIVGFPTEPTLTTLGLGDKLVTAAAATPEEQYEWLRLGERHWLRRGLPTDSDYGNQISYTLKYDPRLVDFASFVRMLKDNQPTVRCCTVMPQEDTSGYEYLPEQPIGREEYDALVSRINNTLSEDVDKAHVDCQSGACPIDFNKA